MKPKEITALAREYAEFTDTSDVEKKHISAICENFLKYTLRRYCLVEKSKLGKDGLDIAWRAKEYHMVILSSDNVYYLFPEIAKEVEE